MHSLSEVFCSASTSSGVGSESTLQPLPNQKDICIPLRLPAPLCKHPQPGPLPGQKTVDLPFSTGSRRDPASPHRNLGSSSRMPETRRCPWQGRQGTQLCPEPARNTVPGIWDVGDAISTVAPASSPLANIRSWDSGSIWFPLFASIPFMLTGQMRNFAEFLSSNCQFFAASWMVPGAPPPPVCKIAGGEYRIFPHRSAGSWPCNNLSLQAAAAVGMMMGCTRPPRPPLYSPANSAPKSVFGLEPTATTLQGRAGTCISTKYVLQLFEYQPKSRAKLI